MPGSTIMLDVDGVLGASIARGPNGVEAHVPAEIAARVRALAALAPITWATSWGAEVRSALSAALGLPEDTDSLAIVPGDDPIEAKRLALDRYLRLHEPEEGWQAVVWIDDGIRQRERDWAAGSAWPVTAIAVNREHQLSDGHVAAAREALGRKCASASRGPRRLTSPRRAGSTAPGRRDTRPPTSPSTG